jgi:SAM-dependent methyltransferase
MTATPLLTDRGTLSRHRLRASRMSGAETFLHELAADVLEERLDEVKRDFTRVAVVTGHGDFWARRFPGARIVPDDELLNLEPLAYDLVLHTLALHWANDPVGQLIQARRALVPDGLFLCATFGGRTLFELRAVLAEAEVSLTGGLSPRVLPMGEIRDLGALLQRAGFALPVADNLTQVVSYESGFDLIRDLRRMGETNALAERNRRMPPRRLFQEAMRVYSTAFPDADGRVRATFELVFLTGWAPSDTQPKPLRPGSAKARLADALGTFELPAGDQAGRSGD